MDINDIQEELQQAAKTVQLTKPIWPSLPDLLRRWRTPKQADVLDHQEPVRALLRDNARDILASLELTMDAAFHILGPEFDSEDVMDPTWQKRWIAGAANVAADDAERRTWWSRLLAGELQTPGSYSLRTLSIMDNLSPTEAQLFRGLCSCVWRNLAERPVLIMPDAFSGKTWGMTDGQAGTLAETGLVHMHALGYQLDLTKGGPHLFRNGVLDLIVVPTADKALSISTMELTTAGREILNLVEAIPDQAYVREVIVELKKHATVFHAAHTPQGWTAGKEVVV